MLRNFFILTMIDADIVRVPPLNKPRVMNKLSLEVQVQEKIHFTGYQPLILFIA